MHTKDACANEAHHGAVRSVEDKRVGAYVNVGCIRQQLVQKGGYGALQNALLCGASIRQAGW